MENKLPIFWGLKDMPVSVAQDLALYMRQANGASGTINAKGHLETSEVLWKRPLADKNFKVLEEALTGNNVPWIEFGDGEIKIDFTQLEYNLEWVKKIIQKHKLGVCDSGHGLMIYEPKEANGFTWFMLQEWRMKGVTVETLGLTRSSICATYPNCTNPRTAEVRTLYFSE